MRRLICRSMVMVLAVSTAAVACGSPPRTIEPIALPDETEPAKEGGLPAGAASSSSPSPGKAEKVPAKVESKCDAEDFLGERAIRDGDDPMIHSVDLNGNGTSETWMVYRSDPAGRLRWTAILRPTAAPACYEAVYNGPGSSFVEAKTTTNGWRDLDLTFAWGPPWTGYAHVKMTFDGKKYRWGTPISCESAKGVKMQTKECEKLLRALAPRPAE